MDAEAAAHHPQTLQTALMFHTGTEQWLCFMIKRETELAREWSLLMHTAQVDLKKVFDCIFHCQVASLWSRKKNCLQLVVVLCSWWRACSLESRFGHAVTEQPVIVDRGCRKGAPESPLVFVMVTDEIRGGLRQKWLTAGHGWKCDDVDFLCLGYADDILSFSHCKESLEVMIDDCCGPFAKAGLEVVWTTPSGAAL